jgi:hypothetical protein
MITLYLIYIVVKGRRFSISMPAFGSIQTPRAAFSWSNNFSAAAAALFSFWPVSSLSPNSM